MRIPILRWAGLTVLYLALALPTPTEASKVQRTIETYTMPNVMLTNQAGETIPLDKLVDQDKPVLVDFIYATCTTICPVLSAGFSNMQRKLKDQSEKVQLISISIDPEHDHPEVMAEYLARYRSRPGWDYVTGTRGDIDAVMHAFDAYVSNKMSHYPLILIKMPESNKWVRLYGLVGTRQLFEEVESLYGPLLPAGGN